MMVVMTRGYIEGWISLLRMILFIMLVLFIKCILAVREESERNIIGCIILVSKFDCFLMICREDTDFRIFLFFMDSVGIIYFGT